MSAERDLDKSLKRIIEIEKEISSRAPNLAEQASLLEEEIDRNYRAGGDDSIDLLAKLCLLSEICGALDFDRMIEAREHFQEAFPEHFSHYLSNLETIGWKITWPGCLECGNFKESCALGLVPLESRESRNHFNKFCSSKKVRETERK
ncbi:MAG: hypothetical protein M1548_04380 [Actinobacteria bacterium]|nr:hypothetical protein [Actinomycetota bacterium]